MFKTPKRCEYCAHKLDENGKCINEKCIAYSSTTTNNENTGTTTEETEVTK